MDRHDVSSAVVWFRRDLRLSDNPAVLDGLAAGGGSAVALFVIDPLLWQSAGPVRQTYLLRSLAALGEGLDGRLLVRAGEPAHVVSSVAREVGAASVHVAADFGPYGTQRDAAVERRLTDAGMAFVRTGSPYAVAPGRVTKDDGTPYRVYTPFHRAWLAHGWRAPAAAPDAASRWVRPDQSDALPEEPDLGDVRLPPVGELAALERWAQFVGSGALDHYADRRDRPDLAGTSGLSAALRWGEVHPRTLLADLGGSKGHEVFRKELAWREFYADVLYRQPASARQSLRPELADLEPDVGPDADERFAAWSEGRTGYPFVDAGMRQLRTEGWMHNRVRMVTASFLVKDLHLDWTRGARHFMHWLRDGDLASNQHGWQWVAGTGSDAAPYFRVFNPVAQGLRFDPDGTYVRRYVPELRSVAGPAAHEPWTLGSDATDGYAERIVDHAAERAVTLARYSAVRGSIGPLSPPS
jgi:deoxyribodipyrimidine photo-lyase